MLPSAFLTAFLIGGSSSHFAGMEQFAVSANPMARYTVCALNPLVVLKRKSPEVTATGARSQSLLFWSDLSNGRGLGLMQANGWVYAPAAAKRCAAEATLSVNDRTQVFEHITGAKPRRPLFGVNLSGAEAGGSDAVRPSLSDFKGYVERFGFQLIRYPFRLDRMTRARIAELKANVAYARSKGVPTILDRHDYTWRKPEVMIAEWTAFARHFPDDGLVILDLVNEPRGFDDAVVTNDWMQWIRDSKLIIAGLRKNGIRHPIALEYPGWSATFRFDKGEKPDKACESAGCALDRDEGGPLDPIDRTYINAHRYWDKGSSGTSMSCDMTWGATSGFDGFAAQLRKRRLKAYITEAAFGASHSVKDNCKGIGADAIADIKANSDVLLGLTWWGGGRIWPESYHFKIEPKKDIRFKVSMPPFIRQLRGD